MEKYNDSRAAALPKIRCAIRTKYPEVERLIAAILGSRFAEVHEGEPDLTIKDSEGGITLYPRGSLDGHFLERPFSAEIFESAVNALLPAEPDAGFSADNEHHLAILGERSVHLTPTEFRLFSAILENGNVFISTKELSEKVWGKHDRNLCTVYISYLRRKLDDTFGVGTLITASGKGYKLRDPHQND